MAGVPTGRAARFALAVAVVANLLAAPSVQAFEAWDGRIQFHGFGEMQVRGISSGFQQELDLTQWYNIINLELEVDILPDGWGPIDLLQAYIRAEGRYDCIWTRGCGMLPSVNTFGDRSKRLPARFRSAENADYSGVIQVGPNHPRITNKQPATVVPPRELVPNLTFRNPATPVALPSFALLPPAAGGVPDPTSPGVTTNPILPIWNYHTVNPPTENDIVDDEGFPGIGIFFGNAGADGNVGTPDDPAMYLYRGPGGLERTRFALKKFNSGGDPQRTQIMGPWRPKDEVREFASLKDRANPFRGRVTPRPVRQERLHAGFLVPGLRPNVPGESDLFQDEFLAFSFRSGILSFLGFDPITPDPFPEELIPFALNPVNRNGGIVFPNRAQVTSAPTPDGGNGARVIRPAFGGDYSGIIPCANTDWETGPGTLTASNLSSHFLDNQALFGCLPRSARPIAFAGPGNTAGLLDPSITLDLSRNFRAQHNNIRIVGGTGEAPFRPGPDVSNLAPGLDKRTAQGIYYPSAGIREYLAEDDLDAHCFQIHQMDRSFNRGCSQKRRTKELKEAYIDMEYLDSRLWVRLGLQNIVWGKTELFRTTDQFNPVDLALASLPGLEESRIALWAGRFVYSLYNVGPLEDVRLEFAFNFDKFQETDLGACGEPYTIDIVCSLTTGLWAHGIFGIGVVGFDYPSDPWRSTKGLEIGGRVEWRWDRFSFAVVDFYGYNDFPFPDRIFTYERNVDPYTGRPRIAASRGSCTGLIDGARYTTRPDGLPNLREVDFSDAKFANPGWTSANANSRQAVSSTFAGIGRDPACLKPGGAPLGRNEYSGLNENGFGIVRGADGLPTTFVEMGSSGGYVPSLLPGFFAPLGPQPTEPELCDPTEDRFDPADPAFDGTICAPDRTGTRNPPNLGGGQITKVPAVTIAGQSPENALENHSINQQLFAWACAGTVSIAGALDAGACAFTIFNSGNELVAGEPNTPPFNEVLSSMFAGEVDLNAIDFWDTISIAQRGASAVAPPNNAGRWAVASLNRNFAWDGVITSTHPTFNKGGGPLASSYFDPDSIDWLTLDSVLSNEQRALLGCGPFYGVRCDSAAVVESSVGFPLALTRGTGNELWGGIDFGNMEASAFEQSWIGFEGTELTNDQNGTGFGSGSPVYSDSSLPSQQRTLVDPTDDPDDLAAPRVTISCPGDPRCMPGYDFTQSVKLSSFANSGIWSTTSTLNQPGTVEYIGGAVCTRFVEGKGSVTLPGCRGAIGFANRGSMAADGEVVVIYEWGFDARVDGCNVGETIGRGANRLTVRGVFPDGTPVDLDTCFDDSDHKEGTYNAASFVVPGSRTLWHPFAGCFFQGTDTSLREQAMIDAVAGLPCDQRPRYIDSTFEFEVVPSGRDFGQEFIDGDTSGVFGSAQIFRNEMAALSWNFMQFLILVACNDSNEDVQKEQECFDDRTPYKVGKCSYSTPQFCFGVQGFLGAAGPTRNTVRAGGNGQYGRRTFSWQAGGQVVLAYEKRNVFGFSMDFAEDMTKTNWGMEFTWVGPVPFGNQNEIDNVSRSDTLNMTISVDRPTFINFLNANRTFFINSQWFFQYITDYKSGFQSNGPWNVLFTFAVFTGYFQDRLLPTMVTVYDFQSQSGGFLPSINYRFNEAFSVGVGMSIFIGHTQLIDMPTNGIGPNSNQVGENAYLTGTDQFLSLFRDRDEVWFRLRYTF